MILNNVSIPIPKGIGIDPTLHKKHSLDKYGPRGMMSPLHTHDNNGIIPVEYTAINKNYTLGQFLSVWGIDLKDKSLKLYVNNKPVLENYGNHVLRDGEQITLRSNG